MHERVRICPDVGLDLGVRFKCRDGGEGLEDVPVPGRRGEDVADRLDGLNRGADVERGGVVFRVDGGVVEGRAARNVEGAAYCASEKWAQRNGDERTRCGRLHNDGDGHPLARGRRHLAGVGIECFLREKNKP